jgi:adenine-specific DNA-methyltransferase
MPAATRRGNKARQAKVASAYEHPEAKTPMRPEVGTQAEFKKKKPPATYRYDSSISPALGWDGQNPAREQGEALLREILEAETLDRAKESARKLKAMSRPFLDWAGKAERLSFDVPTLPLFVHERLSTRAILETLKGHRRDKQQSLFELFNDPQHSIKDQVLRAYEYQDDWVNRLILGDSLVVMNSLLRYEGLGGQVQMIYMDPPYGVKFGSNFQPFVRKRDVSHGDDDDLTREPEMVQAYRDTWELGLHSYLTYMRDRLLLSRDLLSPSGSIFVQISDENLHHVRELMDEVFGPENSVAVVVVKKTGGLGTSRIKVVADYLLWFAKDKAQLKYRPVFERKELGRGETTGERYDQLASPDGKTRRPMTKEERENPNLVQPGWRAYQLDNLTSGAFRENTTVQYEFEGEVFHPGENACWKTTVDGLERLKAAGRLLKAGRTLRYVRYLDDFPAAEIANVWSDVAGAADKLYVVQTSATVIERCLLMTTDPGDLVLDPTCGSGTTPYVAEQWGRRWIGIDVSRVPLALARQRLLTATFDWYELKEEARGPGGGFVYKRKQNSKGEEVGGIVPHVTLKSIANDEPAQEEVLVDRPEVTSGITRVTGPFAVEATIPTPVDWEGDGIEDSGADGKFVDRMLEVLRRSPVLRVEGGKSLTLKNVRMPAKTLSLSAEATVEDRPVALVFGPENGAVSESLVNGAAKEARGKSYSHLYVIGFAIQPHARGLIETLEEIYGVPGTYIQATPDILMGDLLKNMRSSQIFSVCGLPEIDVWSEGSKRKGEPPQYQVKLHGIDVFDPVTMQSEAREGNDVPAWFLDTDYNGLCFKVCQAFFPRTGAWEGLKRALKGEYDDSVWEHLAGDESAPFLAGEHRRIAVKVIDDRGNELLVVKDLPKR